MTKYEEYMLSKLEEFHHTMNSQECDSCYKQSKSGWVNNWVYYCDECYDRILESENQTKGGKYE